MRNASGAETEQAAEKWLRARGLKLLARNYRCRRGELDLVMLDRDSVVFIEVRLRNRNDFGGAAASVTATKQRRLSTAAAFFLAAHPALHRYTCRFDVVAVSQGMNGQPDFYWIRDAFAAWE